NEVFEEIPQDRLTLPHYMWRMQEMMGGGVRQGSIVSLYSGTSTGKSTHVNRILYHFLFNSPITPTIVSLEATAAQYVVELLGIHLGRNLTWEMNGEEIVEFLRTEEGERARRELTFKENGQPRFFIIDEREGDIKGLEEQMELIYKKHDSKLFIIDVLNDMLRGSQSEYAEDHMRFQRAMVKNGVT